MKTGEYFNQRQLVQVSELTNRQLRTLKEYGLIESKDNSPKYDLIEAIYCRLVALLRQEYSMQYVRDVLEPCRYYGSKLITKETGFISVNPKSKSQLSFHKPITFTSFVHGGLIMFDRKLIFLKDNTTKQINSIWINFYQIVSTMIDRAYEYNFDNINLKFENFLNLES